MLAQYRLAVIAAGGLLAIGGDVAAVDVLPAQLPKPTNSGVFELLFSDGYGSASSPFSSTKCSISRTIGSFCSGEPAATSMTEGAMCKSCVSALR